jgi:hypothetical protein
MFKATHKRRVTTLSKTLLTAGLLGGAALSTLAAGSAQAASDQRDCSFGDSIAHIKCSLIDWATGWKLEDKTLTNLTYFSDPLLTAPPSGTFSFVYDDFGAAGLSIEDEWTTLTTFDEAIGPPPTGSYSYNLAITQPGWYFNDVELDSDHVGVGTKAKKVVENAFALGTPIATLESINGMPDGPVPISGTSIKVTDSWDTDPNTGKISSISNSFTQVPAPLPLLGVGAVFGSIRKLRKFSSQLKTFSMG